MFILIIKTVKSHLSLLVIILGAVCFLLTNLLLKEILSEYEYGKYSIIISFLSIIYIFGLLGFEQFFIRFSNSFQKNIIQTQKNQLIFLTIIIIVTTALSTFFYLIYFQEKAEINRYLLFASNFCMIATLILFNIFRLNGNFALSQFISNGWKIGLFLVVIAFFLFHYHEFTTLINWLLSLVIAIWFMGMLYLLKKIKFKFDTSLNLKETFTAFFLFFISISAFSIVMFADRFIIESKLGTIVFGHYFYLTNFILAPFSILQNYVGFKQVVHFKNNFTIKGFIDFGKQILGVSLALSIAIIIMIIILININLLNFDFQNYLTATGLLLLLGIVRLYSSSVLPAFEAKTSLPTLKKANIITITSTIVISIFVVLWVDSLNGIIMGFISIWIIRSIVYRQLLLSQVRKELKSRN